MSELIYLFINKKLKKIEGLETIHSRRTGSESDVL